MKLYYTDLWAEKADGCVACSLRTVVIDTLFKFFFDPGEQRLHRWRETPSSSLLSCGTHSAYTNRNRKTLSWHEVDQGGRGRPPFPNFWINENKCVFNKHAIKAFVRCSCQCPEISVPSTRSLTLSCFTVVVLEATHEARMRALKGQLKKIFKGQRPRRGNCWEY